MITKKKAFTILVQQHCCHLKGDTSSCFIHFIAPLTSSFLFISFLGMISLQKIFHFCQPPPQKRLHCLRTTLSTNNGTFSHLYHWPCLLEGNSWVLSKEDWFDFGHYLLIDKTSAGALLIPWGKVCKMEDMFLPNDIDATHTRSNSTNVCVESTQSLYLVSFSISNHSLRTPITKDCTSLPESLKSVFRLGLGSLCCSVMDSLTTLFSCFAPLKK